jgi:putative glutamine amidotransferase
MKKITIGITDCSKYENYHRWFAGEHGVEVVRLSHHENNIDDIRKCDGIVLSGGEDIHPRYYNKTECLELCHEIDEARDEFEWKVLDYTEPNKIPVLGICRGLQVANVYFGGTLLPHIPAFGKFDHSGTSSDDRYHTVHVDPNSLLKEAVGATYGEINSAHHQGADRIGKGLVTNALSPDGIVEGLERQAETDEAFLLLVQWHPERMKDQESAFSKHVKHTFLDAVRRSKS